MSQRLVWSRHSQYILDIRYYRLWPGTYTVWAFRGVPCVIVYPLVEGFVQGVFVIDSQKEQSGSTMT